MNFDDIKTPRIYVAATRQNDGKTTASIGLISMLKKKFKRLGFIKPVGQRYVEVNDHKIDADAFFMRNVYGSNNEYKDMSPVAVDRNFTRRYLDNPDLPPLEQTICDSFSHVALNNDIVVIEGTGHAGVGSVFDLDNAHVAAMLNSPVVIVACGGIGKPFDEISLNRAVFEKEGVPILGIILNKVNPEKIEEISYYFEKALKRIGLPLLAVIPTSPRLRHPTIRHVRDSLNAEILNGKDNLGNHVNEFIVGAMTPHRALHYFKKNSLVITPGDRDDLVLTATSLDSTKEKMSDHFISGLVLTGGVNPRKSVLNVIRRTNIPVLLTKDDTYSVASCLNDMMVKIKPEETNKIHLVQKLYKKHFDIDKLIEQL